MYITANDEDVEIVEEQRNGSRYLVAKDVPIVKPMRLDSGYVPEASIAQSTELQNTHGATGWSGTTPTINHPRNRPEFSWHDPSRPNNELVLAANEVVRETLGVGTVENDYWDGEFIRANIAVNADRAEEMGGEAADIVAALESDGPLEVSSQYLHAELPAGNYDGAYRENPKAIAAPDSVALIPNGRGVCSIEDGCGIAPGVTANIADHPASVGWADDPVSPEIGLGEGQRRTANVMQEQSTAAGVRQFLSGMASLLGATAGPRNDTAANGPTDAADDGGESNSDEEAESSTDADTTANSTMEDDTRAELIRFITANSELKEDSLEHMGDTCLENTHEMVVANAADDGSDGSDADGGDNDDSTDDANDDVTGDGDGGDNGNGSDTADGFDAVMDRLDNIEDQMVTADSIDEHVATAANQLEKEDRAERIVANSDEYGEDDVEWISELPEKELERKEQSVSFSGGLPGTGSPDLGTSANEDEPDAGDMPQLEVN